MPDLYELDRYHRGRALIGLGEDQLRVGHPVIAINFFGQALVIMEDEGTAADQAEVWEHLADAARHRRDPDAERASLDRARKLGEPSGA